MSERILLDPTIKSFEAQEFENKLFSKVVGQDRAVRKMASLYQVHLSGMASAGRPVGNLLFLGPTGSGKTRVVEAAAEILFGDSKAVLKIDCAEFQHNEIASSSDRRDTWAIRNASVAHTRSSRPIHTDKLKPRYYLMKLRPTMPWQLLLNLAKPRDLATIAAWT
jgi:DNA polymerase III delta prime subunit